MPRSNKKHRVRRGSSSGDVFIPVIILLAGITALSLLIAFVWQKWQDKYDPDYLYPDRSSSRVEEPSESSSQPESSSQVSSEPEQPSVQFGQPLPETDRVRSEYFNDAIFIGDSLTTGIQLYNILPDTTVLASVGINLDNISTKAVIGEAGSQQTILEASSQIDAGKIYIMLGANGLKGLGVDQTVKLYRSFVDEVRAAHPDAIIYVQSILPINEQKFEANYGYSMTNAEIDECNAALLEMTGEAQVYYVDVASVIKDETGGLPADYTTDGLHFKGEYYNKWIDYLKEHTVPAQ